MSCTPQQDFPEFDRYLATCPSSESFTAPRDFLEFDCRYGAYQMIRMMAHDLLTGPYSDDLLQELVTAIVRRGIIEGVALDAQGKTENDWKNMFCWRARQCAKDQLRLQFYSGKYSDKRLSPEKKMTARFKSLDQIRTALERKQKDPKGQNLETNLGIEITSYRIVTPKHFQEYHLFHINLCIKRGDLAERLIESLYFGSPPLDNGTRDQLERAWSVFGDDRRIPTSKRNPENRITADIVERLAKRAGWDSFPHRTLYHDALLLQALPRPISDELRLLYQELNDRWKSGNSNLCSARREKLRPHIFLVEDFLKDGACLPGYLREFERRARLEALLSFWRKTWSLCVRLASKKLSFLKLACATSAVQVFPS